jgi:hypothetical protein
VLISLAPKAYGYFIFIQILLRAMLVALRAVSQGSSQASRSDFANTTARASRTNFGPLKLDAYTEWMDSQRDTPPPRRRLHHSSLLCCGKLQMALDAL